MPKEANINRYIFKKCRRLFWNDPKKIALFPVIKKAWPYSLNGYVTLVQVCDAVDELEKNKVRGAIVEMGCWNGGLGALMAWRCRKHNSRRTVWCFDSFEGLPEFSEADKEKADKKGLSIRDIKNTGMKATGVFKAEIGKVREISKKLNVDDVVRPVKGWFQDTVPAVHDALRGGIALLYLDADIYESTKYCLDALYDLVVPGGMIILDDYETWTGSRQALYEFFSKQHIAPSIRYYPYGGRPFIVKN